MKKTNLLTAIYSLVASITFLIAPLITSLFILDDVMNDTSGTNDVDMFFRFLAGIMVILSLILLIKDRKAMIAGKILVLIGGAIIIIFSSLLGFVGGVCGIVGASLLLVSNKYYKKIDE